MVGKGFKFGIFVLALLFVMPFATAPWASVHSLDFSVQGNCVGQDVVVRVEAGGIPVEGAIITVSKGLERITEATTDESGKATVVLGEAEKYEFRARTTIAVSAPAEINIVDCSAPVLQPQVPETANQDQETTEDESQEEQEENSMLSGLFALGSSNSLTIVLSLIVVVLLGALLFVVIKVPGN